MSHLIDRSVARVGAVVAATLALTALLAIPFLTMAPTSSASPEPGGPVFDARDTIEERFEIQVFPTFMVLEAAAGDILAPEILRELHAAEQRLRDDEVTGPLLLERFDRASGQQVDGVLTVADIVDAQLQAMAGTDLADAPDALVEQVTAGVVGAVGPTALGLSTDASADEDGVWHAAATSLQVLSDNEALGGGSIEVAIGTDDTTREEFSRDLVRVLGEGSDAFTVYGVANDANLTAAEEGMAAGPFIGFTIVGVLAVVGLTFRSYWAVAVTGGALAMLIVWLRGLSNLIGLKSDQILDTVVPIALISFGIDFAFHAIGRYREEADAGRPPLRAVSLGLASVMGALVLALSSDAVAFLSNAVAGIESIVQFGVASTIGLVSAFVLLGVVAPIVIAHLEGLTGRTPSSRRGRVAAMSGGTAAAFTVMATVLLGVYVHPPAGVALLGLYVTGFLVVPWLVARRRTEVAPPGASVPAHQPSQSPAAGPLGAALARMSGAVAVRGRIVLPLAAILTGVLGSYAVQIPTEFDVKDFFSADAGFVVGLDKLDEFVGAQGGEPATILVEGDLATVRSLRALADFDARIDQVGRQTLALDDDGEVALQAGVLDVVQATMGSPSAMAQVTDRTGVDLVDADGDMIPDTDAMVAALIGTALADGVPLDDGVLAFTPDDVAERFDPATDDRPRDATVLGLNLPGSREAAVVSAAAALLEAPVDQLSADLASDEAAATLTGSPFVREGGMAAITRSLLVSLPIAIVLCFAIGAAFMRSVRYGLIAIVPIMLVVAWLYGMMERTGFAINLVTGTIGAISIGIGIDFAIHYIMRFREEMAVSGDRLAALRTTGERTGTALVASSASSILGFAILALAPMPLFASYGLLTAVMIAMALVASLVVLPPLLYVTGRDVAPADPDAGLGSVVQQHADDDITAETDPVPLRA